MSQKSRSILEDYVNLFATAEGRRVLEDLQKSAGFYDCKVPVGAPIDTTRLIWNEAQRALVLEITNCAAFDFSKEPGNTAEKQNG